MLRTITPREMKRLENRIMADTGVTGAELMERAAGAVARAVEKYLEKRPGRVWCVCGTGNNGGDGMAALRILCAGRPERVATVWLMAGELYPDAQEQKARLEREAPWVRVEAVGEMEGQDGGLCKGGGFLPGIPSDTACVIDALFGTGLSREVTGRAAELCRLMEKAYRDGIPVLAVDIPSGLNGETGEIMGVAARATETVTFHRPKTGLYLGKGLDASGQVVVADIGLPSERDNVEGFRILEEADLPALLPPRPRVCHKGNFGRVLVMAGSLGMAGAAAISALAALRTGAGLVTVACPEAIVSAVQTLCPCATCLPLPTGNAAGALKLLTGAMERADAVAIGPGLGTDAYARELMEGLPALLRSTDKPAVLDADGLNLLVGLAGESGDAGRPLLTPHQILTPHPGEAARLLGISTAQVVADVPGAAVALQNRYGASVVLKGAASVLLSEKEKGLNELGTPGLAKGGSGDALTGVLVALLAMKAQGAFQGSLFQLLQAGTALHGLAGMAAAREYGERGMLATDLCDELGRIGSVEYNG